MGTDSFSEVIVNYRNLIDDSLLSLIVPKKPEYLYKPITYALKGKGKRLRPILLLIVGKMFEVPVSRAMPAALSVELLHNFSLIHDDIMDGDSTRHGKPTIHNKWDNSTAILAGDGVFSMVYHQIAQVELHQLKCLNIMNKATLQLCEGQALDKEFESRESVSVVEYLTMVALKTGALLSLCCQLGAILGNADDRTEKNMEEFGVLLGQLFQIQDDVLEIYSDSQKMGKSLGSDVTFGKKTYLTCTASEKNPEGWHNFIRSLREKDIQTEVLPAMRSYFKEEGILQKAASEVYAMMGLAKLKLDGVREDSKSDLLNLVDLIASRKR